MHSSEIAGFTEDTLVFLDSLAKNNTREWFHAHKKEYESSLKVPATIFCEKFAGFLKDLYGVSVRHKIFRINRDLRFSKDKTPYNTHLRSAFAPEASLGLAPSWFFSLEPDKLTIGLGVIAFPKADLLTYRERVDGADGEKLQKILHRANAQGLRLSPPELKRVPAPFEKDHQRAALLRHKSLCLWVDLSDPRQALGDQAAEDLVRQLGPAMPLFEWLQA